MQRCSARLMAAPQVEAPAFPPKEKKSKTYIYGFLYKTPKQVTNFGTAQVYEHSKAGRVNPDLIPW